MKKPGMKKLGSILMTAAVAASAPTALAQAAPHTLVDEQMQRRLFLLKLEQQNGRMIFERGSSDDVMGVVCHWKGSGALSPETGDVSVQIDHKECKQTSDIPAGWGNGPRMAWDKSIPSVRDTRYSIENESTVDETVTSKPDGSGFSSTYRRLWNFTQNSVCLTYSVSKTVNGVSQPYLGLDAGCYEIPNNPYADKLRKKLHDQYKFY